MEREALKRRETFIRNQQLARKPWGEMQRHGSGAFEARQLDGIRVAPDTYVHKNVDIEIHRRKRCDSAEQLRDAGRREPMVVGEADYERTRGAGDLGERGAERLGPDVVEGELGEAGPETAPPAGQQAGVRGGAGAAEAGEDLEEHVVGEGADAVDAAAAPDPGAARKDPRAAAC